MHPMGCMACRGKQIADVFIEGHRYVFVGLSYLCLKQGTYKRSLLYFKASLRVMAGLSLLPNNVAAGKQNRSTPRWVSPYKDVV